MGDEACDRRSDTADGSPGTLICVATYNERANLPELVRRLFEYAAKCHILVIDDDSPDGTGTWCDEFATRDNRLSCLHRPQKQGLGTAALTGLRYAVEHGYDLLVNLDADLSHDPADLPRLLASFDSHGSGPVDVVVGSRYVTGGRIDGWPWTRRVMSRVVNASARLLLGLTVRDSSGSFRCYRVASLQPILSARWRSRGYSIYEEILWHLQQSGAVCVEVPITFTDRRQGQTKLDVGEACRSAGVLLALGCNHWWAQLRKLRVPWRGTPK